MLDTDVEKDQFNYKTTHGRALARFRIASIDLEIARLQQDKAEIRTALAAKEA